MVAVDEHAAAARRVVSESMLRIVEVLALFVTLAGFLILSGAVVLQADMFWRSVAAVTVLMVGAATFFALLRVIVRFEATSSSWWGKLRRTRSRTGDVED